MSISQADLEKIAQLAYLDVEEDNSSQLCQEVSSIMDFVEQLRSVNTSGITPLFHPLALNQRCRPDVITEEDCTKELANIAPLFEDNLYLVPKVIEGGK
jgi:aspartyl-tRNA(Asn)/glutamyl-tRNA(Gln) amidotransferase subunit C